MLSAWQAIVLGIIQGLTEFLPVSSSGHLVIFQSLLGFKEPMILFDVFLHVGTLFAVFAAFWDDIRYLFSHILSKEVGLLIIATIPAALMGYFLEDYFTLLFSSVIAVACALILTGILLFISDRFKGKRSLRQIGIKEALLIGVFQGLAITPGLSRSGSTIFGALLCQMNRKDAARFSFILSIPIILGAAVKSAIDMAGAGTISLEWTYFLGAVVAAVFGYLAIKIFLKLLAKANLRIFSYYCWLIAAIVIITQLVL